MAHTCRRTGNGGYHYRGFIIRSIGYYPPESRIIWEAVHEIEKEWVIPGYTKQSVKEQIDFEMAKGEKQI